MTYVHVELPEDVTANILANGEGAKCSTKKTGKKAIIAKVEKLEKTVTKLRTRNGELKKRSSNADGETLGALRECEQKLKDAETVCSEQIGQIQGLEDALGSSTHKAAGLRTTLNELKEKHQECVTQNRLDTARIESLETRVKELKDEVEWFKKLAYQTPASTGAQAYASGSMSMRNTVSPGT